MPSLSNRKTFYTLSVNDYEPMIQELTFPLMEQYALKIGADFEVIEEREFPSWPVPVEKLQISQKAKENRDEWSIYADADCLISPDMFDVTEHLRKDTVCQNGRDFAGVRLNADKYFRRDGRWTGCCGWFTVASDWCASDLWRMPDDLTPEQAIRNCHSTVAERLSGVCDEGHLVDDYLLARNIARFGLKYKTVTEICAEIGWKTPDGRGFNPALWHIYALPREEKIRRMLSVLYTEHQRVIPDPENPNKPPVGSGWGLMSHDQAADYMERWKKEIYFPPAPEIQGWMTHVELDWLFKQARAHQQIVEIGSWFGRSTHALCTACDGHVSAVDHFQGSPAELAGPHQFAKTGDVFAEFWKNCGDFDNMEAFKMPSAEAAAQFGDGSLDMVFVDGDHTKAGVLADLTLWRPKLRPGGLLCGHDRYQDGVPAALTEFFGEAPAAVAGSIWATSV